MLSDYVSYIIIYITEPINFFVRHDVYKNRVTYFQRLSIPKSQEVA